jgi:hypothetical protein
MRLVHGILPLDQPLEMVVVEVLVGFLSLEECLSSLLNGELNGR